MKTYIGIDLGGTNVRVAKVDESGNIIQECKEASEVHNGKEALVAKMVRMVQSLDNYQECLGVGCAVPGPVDKVKNVMTMSTNIPGFDYYEFAEIMSIQLGIPVYLDNDVNAAALGEAMLGAGKNDDIVYYVTISTGIGGGLVVNKKVHGGRNGYAGEVANIVIDRNREKHNHLNIGAVENEASGLAIIKKASALYGREFESAKELFDLALEGDEKAQNLVNEMALDIALMLSSVAHVIDPHIFIFGGGVMKSKDVFFPKVHEHFKNLVHDKMSDVKFTVAELNEPGLVGAAMLVKEKI